MDPAKKQQSPPMANYCAQDFHGLQRLIRNRISKPFHDVWICLGTQLVADTTKTSYDGYFKAVRKQGNIVSLKSIFLDIDVKPDAYASTEDAARGLAAFVIKAGLPRPTMIVKSGSGGLHVYWCTAEQMSPEMWRPLATALQQAGLTLGLKFDPQVTVDIVRVLRVPTSLNWKTGAPTKVELVIPLNEEFPVYSYADLTTALAAYIGNISGVKTGTGGTGRSSNFTANVGTQAAPVALDDIAAVCPLVNDTVNRGGNGDPEPLWSMMIMLASFTDDPITSAHRLSSGDARYSQVETDRKIQEKINARAANPKIGWPQCSGFAPLNPHCRTCPMVGQGKSPLNFIAKPGTGPAAMPAQGDTMLPEPYWRCVNGHAWLTYEEQGITRKMDLLGHRIIDAAIDEDNSQLVFKTIIMGHEVWVTVPSSHAAQTATLITKLASAPSGGINLPSENRQHARVRSFVVAWITHLQQQRKTINVANYGWSEDMETFTYSDKTFTKAGTERSYQTKANPVFRQVGKLQPWMDAMALIYGKHALEIVVASSFAAPLTAMLGTTSSVLSIYSSASGVGKSTAMKLAQSVWGHPTSGMSTLDDTVNSVKKKIADLKSLPAYWDELITADATEKVVDLVFSFTQGKAKSRLTANSEQMDAPSFVTMFAMASNHGVGSRLYQDTSGTEAGGLRIFEIEANPHPMSHSLTDANKLVGDLSMNYGCAGLLFAEKLIADRATVETALDMISRHLDKTHLFDQKERYWRATMVVIVTGAYLANRYGLTTFDLPGMMARLGLELERQRARLHAKAHVTMSSKSSSLDLLNELQTDLHGKHLVTTDVIPAGMGRPRNIAVIDTDTSRLQGVWMQIGQTDGRIRMVAKKFDRWCLDNKQNPDNVIKMLKQHYDIQIGQFTIGAGVPMLNSGTFGLSGRSTCYDLTPWPTASASPPAGAHSATGSPQQGQP